jgi:hypothetical protein
MSTATASLGRPKADEYAPFYDRYISLVTSEDIVPVLEKEGPETVALFKSATSKADYRYAPGKWTVKEVLGHINDSERIMAYRALRIGRGDKTPIEGFEQDDYVRDSNFAQRSLPDLIDEFVDVRRATISLLKNFDNEIALRRGTANKCETSVRAVAYVIAGHELHHRRILREKYSL